MADEEGQLSKLAEGHARQIIEPGINGGGQLCGAAKVAGVEVVSPVVER